MLFVMILFCRVWGCCIHCFKSRRDGKFFCWVGGGLKVVRGLNEWQWVVVRCSSFLDTCFGFNMFLFDTSA